jgi:hypothetical protein
MANRAIPKGEVSVDSRGRVTGLNKVREGRYTRYRVVEGASGVITLTPVLDISPAELADLQAAVTELRRRQVKDRAS